MQPSATNYCTLVVTVRKLLDMVELSEIVVSNNTSNGTDSSMDHDSSPSFLFVPILIVLMLVTISSNTVLLLLLGRSWKLWTSLNVLLLSLGVLHLLTILNQIFLVVAIIERRWVFGGGMCHFTSFIQMLFTYTTTPVFFLISRDRRNVSKDPLSWKRNRKRAAYFSLFLWCGAGIAAVMDRLLHLEDFRGTVQDFTVCYWAPVHLECSNEAYRFALLVATFTVFLTISAMIYYNYIKTYKTLKTNEKMKEFEVRMASTIAQEKRRKTTSERAITSLAVIFTIHFLTQLPSYSYNLIRHATILSDKTSAEILSESGLISLTCISFLTTASPFALIFINRRYNQHVKGILQCRWDPEEEQDNLVQLLISKESPQPPPPLLPEPKKYAQDRSVFFGGRSMMYASKSCQAQRKLSIETDNFSFIDETPQTKSLYLIK